MDIEDLPEVKPLIQVKKPATLLRPRKADRALPFSVSKTGGIPNLNLFTEWPVCDECGTPLNFILQIYKRDFPEFYFPENTNIFLLFRCPYLFCECAFSEKYDLKMFWFYGNVDTEKNAAVEKPPCTLEEPEMEMPGCSFNPLKIVDYPYYEELDEELWNTFDEKYAGDIRVFDTFMGNYQPKAGIKINGFPSWADNPNYPVCTCGNRKEFFFQISSEEYEEESPFEWPLYGEIMGDCGILHFFVCKQCGPESVETRFSFY